MNLYKLSYWIQPEYGERYDESEEFIFAKSRNHVLQHLSNRGIHINNDNSGSKYYTCDRCEEVWYLEKLGYTECENFRNLE